jgi:Calponin homology (CH) domain
VYLCISLLFSKLINQAQPGTIHEQAVNKPSGKQATLSVFQCHENLTLTVRSAQSIGCSVVNIGPDDLYEGREHLVLGLVWQVIRVSIQDDVRSSLSSFSRAIIRSVNINNVSITAEEFLPSAAKQFVLNLPRNSCLSSPLPHNLNFFIL